MSLSLLLAFVATFTLISLTPGMCMTLSMSLGISIGARRTLWMMLGELVGVALVALAAILGVAALMLQFPTVFQAFKWVGGGYLVYLGWQTWRSPAADPHELAASSNLRSRRELAVLGFVTAMSNPKAWAFFVALLPPFVDSSRPLAPQLSVLLAAMLIIEFICLQLYAHGGRALSIQLHKRGKARWLNHIAGVLMAAVGVWLALG